MMSEKAMASDVLMTTAEVAQILRLSIKTAGGMMRNGELPAMRIGGVWRVRRVSLEEWMKKQERNHSVKMLNSLKHSHTRVR
jgi:excisionase family DNA binding protein